MQPNMAQVLNTLAHEIRTPLAVSQGYLKLYADGRLTTPDEQRRALQQSREALGVIAALCAEMGKVSALSEVPEPMLAARIDAADLVQELTSASELAGAVWAGDRPAGAQIATNAPRDLARAITVWVKAAFDQAKTAPHAVEIHAGHDSLILLAGADSTVGALRAGPGGDTTRAIDVVHGGKGLSLIWAAFVLEQHHVEAWTLQDHKASIGFRIPLVKV